MEKKDKIAKIKITGTCQKGGLHQDEVIGSFCSTCSELCCYICLHELHSGHDTQPLKTLISKVQEKSKQTDDAKKNEFIQKLKSQLAKTKEDIMNKYGQQKHQIEITLKKLEQSINLKFNLMETQITNFSQMSLFINSINERSGDDLRQSIFFLKSVQCLPAMISEEAVTVQKNKLDKITRLTTYIFSNLDQIKQSINQRLQAFTHFQTCNFQEKKSSHLSFSKNQIHNNSYYSSNAFAMIQSLPILQEGYELKFVNLKKNNGIGLCNIKEVESLNYLISSTEALLKYKIYGFCNGSYNGPSFDKIKQMNIQKGDILKIRFNKDKISILRDQSEYVCIKKPEIDLNRFRVYVSVASYGSLLYLGRTKIT